MNTLGHGCYYLLIESLSHYGTYIFSSLCVCEFFSEGMEGKVGRFYIFFLSKIRKNCKTFPSYLFPFPQNKTNKNTINVISSLWNLKNKN